MIYKKTKFVLHKHNAYRAGKHFDLRLKYIDQKMLISFAIPADKFPIAEGEKTIAIQTPDHGMGWLYREKLEIPKGEYGGGFIQRVQHGECTIYRWTPTFIHVEFPKGPFLDGEYRMFMVNRKQSKNPVWILYKKVGEKADRRDGSGDGVRGSGGGLGRNREDVLGVDFSKFSENDITKMDFDPVKTIKNYVSFLNAYDIKEN